MGRYVLELRDIDRTQAALVGGKAASLGELSRIAGIDVPAGFCVTTDAFQRVVSIAPAVADQVKLLSRLTPDDHDTIRARSAEIRRSIEAIVIPHEVADAITRRLAMFGDHASCAVRSSATAEDLPTASFAGQHDTYLDLVGPAAILEHVRRCWASLYTERAVTYRRRNGIDERAVLMAVVVQRMVSPQAAGVLFTADPVTGNRKVTAVEATVGLGEALVSGHVNADVFRVRDGQVIDRTLAPERPQRTALTEVQVVELASLGRRIEAHFDHPQDIEWCLVGDGFHFVQSRPITTLFPIPERDDRRNRVYVSVGHQQMMTDPMKPLGLSLWKLTSRAPMHDAGGRLFVDVTGALAAPASRAALVDGLGKSDPLIGDALRSILDRGFIPSLPDDPPAPAQDAPPAVAPPTPIATDPAVVADLIARSEASVATLEREIATKSGPPLLDFILADLQELRRILFDPSSHQAIMAGMEAMWWLNEHLHAWLGERNAADTLAQSVDHNVTSEMGLALMEVADAVRPHPEVVAFLERVDRDDFLGELPGVPGGREAHDAIVAWLDRFGMRGAGEIDITRPRWRERPTMLVPLILGNVRNFEPGAARRRFDAGRQEALEKEQDLLERLRALPDGERKADETRRMIDRMRTFSGYREYPKYGMISRYFVYKKALLAEAGRLVQAGVLRESDDVFFLTFQEFQEVVRTGQVDEHLLRKRRDAYRSHHALTPPRVLTSEGEAIDGTYRRSDVPPGALAGLPVSGGTVEGRARVVLDMADADLEPGDILVTVYTDPSWTPLFVAAGGLVTEVGGLMTHGAVIAREYGLPAVVGVKHATRSIIDGQRIRVHGTEGFVEVLA